MSKYSTPHDIIHSITHPQRGSFGLHAFEIQVGDLSRNLLKIQHTIDELESLPLSAFCFPGKNYSETKLLETREFALNTQRRQMPSTNDILDQRENDEGTYEKLKGYFKEKSKELGLEGPLIFYDDTALRIDIGYGPSLFETLFPEMFTEGQIYQRLFHENKGFFGKSTRELFTNECFNSDYSEVLQAEQQQLLENYELRSKGQLPQRANIAIAPDASEADVLKQCLEQSPGIILGESHTEKSPKRFLIDNMHTLASNGVSTLYMEHILVEPHQKLLDAYANSPKDAPMPKELESYLMRWDELARLGKNDGLTATVQSAKENGIRIIAFDTEAIYGLGRSHKQSDLKSRDNSRFKAMNIAALQSLETHGDGKKFAFFVGSAHVVACQGVLGLSELTGCPNMVIQDLKKNKSKENFKTKSAYIDSAGTQATFDILYHRSTEHGKKTSHSGTVQSNISRRTKQSITRNAAQSSESRQK